MATFFNTFDTISHAITNVSKPIDIVNILRNIKFTNEFLKSNYNYLKYVVTNSDNPDIIADKLYNDSTLSWLVLLANNMIDPNFDFPLSQTNLTNYISSKYPGKALYFESIGENFVINAKVEGVTSGATGYVLNWDPTLRKLEVESITGTFATDEYVKQTVNLIGENNNQIEFEDEDDLVADIVSDSLVKKIDTNIDALNHFENSDEEWLDPMTTVAVDTTRIDNYIINGSTDNTISNTEYEIDVNDNKRNINLISEEYFANAVNDIEELME